MAEKLDKMKQRLQKLQEQVKLEEQKEKDRDRKRATRRKILLGAYLEKWMQGDPATNDRVMKYMRENLTRRVDREAFSFDDGKTERGRIEQVDGADDGSSDDVSAA